MHLVAKFCSCTWDSTPLSTNCHPFSVKQFEAAQNGGLFNPKLVKYIGIGTEAGTLAMMSDTKTEIIQTWSRECNLCNWNDKQ